MPLKELHVQQFVRRFKERIVDFDGRYAFFLGAGCSISSGIPGAKRLVQEWLIALKGEDTGSTDNLEAWVDENFENYDPDNPATSYADVMKTRFPQPRERQSEIERIVEGKDPGFGYGVFAKLITNDSFGPQCNVVLTSNFDDLVADALYLYTRKKPLVIAHESLAAFARETNRPLVIKVHGDALLDPKNLEDETAELDSNVAETLERVMFERGIVFLGYGGNDKGILKALESLSESAFEWGVYWVNDALPKNEFGEWLEKRNAIWVKHLDFDELMAVFQEEFALERPDEERFNVLMKKYREALKKLSRRVMKKPESEDKVAIEAAVRKATKEFQDAWSVILEARQYEGTDNEKAEEIYGKGLQDFPEDGDLLGVYAYFLHFIRKDHDKADEYYRKAIEADPDDSDNLGNYAILLDDVRKDHDKAEEYYRKAIELDPDNANNLGNYAIFLKNVRKDHDKAEEYYRKAIEADPDHANNLGNYAAFLTNVRKDHDKAEEYFRKAIELDPENAGNLGKYAVFLTYVRKDHDKAGEYYTKVIELHPDNASNLGNYAVFLRLVRKDHDKAEEYFRKAIELDPESAGNLGKYANFLKDVRKDHDKADEYYRKAIEADPDDPDNLGNYAGFLLARGEGQSGWEYLEKARALADTDEAVELELLFYDYAHNPDGKKRRKSLSETKKMIAAGVRSPYWDLTGNVERAVTDKHPEPELLSVLAKVIADEEKASALNKFEAWKKA